jgi:hypothetical protein
LEQRLPSPSGRKTLNAECVAWVTQQTGNHNGRSCTATYTVYSKSERKVDSLPPLRFEPATFGTQAHFSDLSAKSHPKSSVYPGNEPSVKKTTEGRKASKQARLDYTDMQRKASKQARLDYTDMQRISKQASKTRLY